MTPMLFLQVGRHCRPTLEAIVNAGEGGGGGKHVDIVRNACEGYCKQTLADPTTRTLSI